MGRSLEKIKWKKNSDALHNRIARVCKDTLSKIKEQTYVLSFKMASYDKLPTEDDVYDLFFDGIGEEFPNCSFSKIKVKKTKEKTK